MKTHSKSGFDVWKWFCKIHDTDVGDGWERTKSI